MRTPITNLVIRLLGVLGALAFSLAHASQATYDIFTDGGFETPNTWVGQSSGGFDVIFSDPDVAHSGSGYAWLGGYETGVDSVYHDIDIPADAASVAVQFWYSITTEEIQNTGVHDTMVVSVLDPKTNAVLANLATYSDVNVSEFWKPSIQYDISAFRGKSIRLKFSAVNDAANTTSFYLDDIAVLATYGTAGPRLSAISTRMQVLTGNDVMIAGFILTGASD